MSVTKVTSQPLPHALTQTEAEIENEDLQGVSGGLKVACWFLHYGSGQQAARGKALQSREKAIPQRSPACCSSAGPQEQRLTVLTLWSYTWQPLFKKLER